MLLRDRFAPIPMFLMAPDGDGGAAPPAAGASPPPAGTPPAAGDTSAPLPAGTPPAAGAPPAPAPIASGAAPPPATPPAAVQPDFPADWREKVAKGNEAALNTLKRYASPVDAITWALDQQAKISRGEIKVVRPAPGKDASAEEVAEYRKANGLPDKAEAYVENMKLGDGMVIGEADKPLIASFAERAHALGANQDAFNGMVSWWYDTQDQLLAERQQADNDFRIESEQALLRDLGAEFKPSMNALKGFWSEQPAGMQDLVLAARLPDGRVVGDIPEVTRWLVNLARELNPAATLLPAGVQATPQAIGTRKAEIEGMMYLNGKPNPKYFNDAAVQKEYRDLIDAERTMASRAA